MLQVGSFEERLFWLVGAVIAGEAVGEVTQGDVARIAEISSSRRRRSSHVMPPARKQPVLWRKGCQDLGRVCRRESFLACGSQVKACRLGHVGSRPTEGRETAGNHHAVRLTGDALLWVAILGTGSQRSSHSLARLHGCQSV